MSDEWDEVDVPDEYDPDMRVWFIAEGPSDE